MSENARPHPHPHPSVDCTPAMAKASPPVMPTTTVFASIRLATATTTCIDDFVVPRNAINYSLNVYNRSWSSCTKGPLHRDGKPDGCLQVEALCFSHSLFVQQRLLARVMATHRDVLRPPTNTAPVTRHALGGA